MSPSSSDRTPSGADLCRPYACCPSLCCSNPVDLKGLVVIVISIFSGTCTFCGGWGLLSSEGKESEQESFCDQTSQ